jgi:2',3'-cyclic-nucleotide 2'-phosphodiesterase (5'-nucleotidase family)
MVLGALAMTMTGCGKSDREAARAEREPTGKVSILYTCDTRGNVKPCDCKDGDAGGVSRRMTALNSLRNGDPILLDAGDVAGGGRSWEIADYALLLMAYDVMDYHAVNLGAREASIPAGALKEMVSRHPYLLSANVADADGQLIADPYRIITLTNGIRVGVMGVVDDRLPSNRLGEGIQILPLDDAIIKHMPGLAGRSDLVVMLAFVDDQRLHELANLYFEVDVLIGGKVTQPQSQPDKINRTHVVRMTDQGKYVGRLDVELTDGEVTGTTGDTTYLNHEIPDAAAMAPIISLYESSMQEKGRTNEFLLSEPGLQSLGGDAHE